ncbi:ATP-binding cassette domain-containing protein [Limnobacter humi]|uniref:ATP-binding cassette domain-containing protein n=1 Tax=Limnobacter humi TaxID=1778671 RepID=A0ABT1WHD3_9BURK|nr:ATP-binding cassette domain-containing protein [Limnobacter humi]MCQ8896273.1 ATP-binding cassette domain-containing protein [Limnobacter humi]
MVMTQPSRPVHQPNCQWLPSGQLQVKWPVLQAGGVELARNIEMTLPAGELCQVRGSNGCGKSTFLKGLANALNQMAPGQALLLNTTMGFRGELTVLQQLALHASWLGSSDAPEPKLSLGSLDGVLEQLGLMDWRYEYVATLSSGQTARLGLGVLLLSPARVWLLDEPLNTLDHAGQQLLDGLIKRHLAQGGSVLMASHHPWPPMAGGSACVRVTWQFSGSCLQKSEEPSLFNPHLVSPVAWASRPARALGWARALGLSIQRDRWLLGSSLQTVAWSALFFWIVLSLCGFALHRTELQAARTLAWVSLLLAVLLTVKDWFAEDHRIGWLQLLLHASPGSLGAYWLGRCLLQLLQHVAVLLPVAGLLVVQFQFTGSQALQFLWAGASGVLAMVPLLGLLSLLVLLTRGGTALLLVLGLPLLLPVLVFGLEATQAASVGRSALAPLMVLWGLGSLGFLLGVPVARRLCVLVQE